MVVSGANLSRVCVCVCVDETPSSGGGSEKGFHISFPAPSQTEGTGSLQIC